jgi:hypothetical protein
MPKIIKGIVSPGIQAMISFDDKGNIYNINLSLNLESVPSNENNAIVANTDGAIPEEQKSREKTQHKRSTSL